MTPEIAAHVREVSADLKAVGVFVNSSPETVRRICSDASLDVIQLHGDESPEKVAAMPPVPLVLAKRMSADGLDAIASDIGQVESAGRLPEAVLIDALIPGQYGGTGQTVTWSDLIGFRERLGHTRLILAGGLTPENVAEAIRMVQPDGVDVASGVESSPGVKDPVKVKLFVEAARAAFRELDNG